MIMKRRSEMKDTASLDDTQVRHSRAHAKPLVSAATSYSSRIRSRTVASLRACSLYELLCKWHCTQGKMRPVDDASLHSGQRLTAWLQTMLRGDQQGTRQLGLGEVAAST